MILVMVENEGYMLDRRDDRHSRGNIFDHDKAVPISIEKRLNGQLL